MSEPVPESKPEYNENTAILLKDLIVCVARSPQGPAIMSSFQSRQEAVNIMCNVNIEIVNKIQEFDKAKNRIEPVKHGIIHAARNRLFRR